MKNEITKYFGIHEILSRKIKYWAESKKSRSFIRTSKVCSYMVIDSVIGSPLLMLYIVISHVHTQVKSWMYLMRTCSVLIIGDPL